jgi:hypothetical protein
MSLSYCKFKAILSSIDGMFRGLLCCSGHCHVKGPKYEYDVSYNCARMNSSLFSGSK